jgi:hypothetical protein
MAGKLMEKAGGMLKSDSMVEKGQQKRAEAGADIGGYESGNTGDSGNTDSYGSGRNNNY